MGYAAIMYYFFILFYAVFFMSGAIYGTFVPVYLDYIGYNKSEIGILMSLGPFVAIIAQPFWGITSDRARSKNFVLQILFLASIFTMALFPLSRSFYYLIAVIAFFTFFQSSTGPISDAITLEHLSEINQSFGPIRMAGTIGYAVMSVIAGWFAQRYIGSIFVLNIIVMFLAFMIVFKLPVVKGHQFGREHIPIWR
ncbi:MAG TPA: MFS transporter, partial [Thermoanaerobacter sp.]|nr:MFS transporter [Thermoanaerobacter sp.]